MHNQVVTIQLFDKEPYAFSGDLLVCPVEEDVPQVGPDAGATLNRLLQQVRETGDFKGSKDQVFLLYPGLTELEKGSSIQAKRVLFVGLGKQDDLINVRREQLRLVGGTIAKQAGAVKAREVLVVLPKAFLLDAVEIAQCLAEGLLLGNYRFDLYKNPKEEKDTPTRVEQFHLHAGGLAASAVRKGLEHGRILAEAVCTARDMANQPGNGWTPADFAEYAKKISKKPASSARYWTRQPCRNWAWAVFSALTRGQPCRRIW